MELCGFVMRGGALCGYRPGHLDKHRSAASLVNIKIRKRKYQQANRQAVNAKAQAWRDDNREWCAEYQRDYSAWRRELKRLGLWDRRGEPDYRRPGSRVIINGVVS